jgi:hypothetical protein
MRAYIVKDDQLIEAVDAMNREEFKIHFILPHKLGALTTGYGMMPALQYQTVEWVILYEEGQGHAPYRHRGEDIQNRAESIGSG